MTSTTIAGRQFEVSADDVLRVARGLDPEPIDVFFTIVDGLRYPPKQVVEALTGLDRADFNSHQARSLLVRLGFPVERRRLDRRDVPPGGRPAGGAEAQALAPYAGRWIAQDDLEVLYVGESPQDVARWLLRHGQTARVWRVPTTPEDVGSATSTA